MQYLKSLNHFKTLLIITICKPRCSISSGIFAVNQVNKYRRQRRRRHHHTTYSQAAIRLQNNVNKLGQFRVKF